MNQSVRYSSLSLITESAFSVTTCPSTVNAITLRKIVHPKFILTVTELLVKNLNF